MDIEKTVTITWLRGEKYIDWDKSPVGLSIDGGKTWMWSIKETAKAMGLNTASQ